MSDEHTEITEMMNLYTLMYRQDLEEVIVSDLVGHWVQGEGTMDGEPVGFVSFIIGYVKQVIKHPQTGAKVWGYFLISNEGVQYAWLRHMEVKEISEQEAQEITQRMLEGIREEVAEERKADSGA